MIAELHKALRDSELCGPNAQETETTLRFDYGRVVVTVSEVPALYCPDLDETLVPGPIGVMVSDMAAEIAEMAQDFLAKLEAESRDATDQKVEISQRLRQLLPA